MGHEISSSGLTHVSYFMRTGKQIINCTQKHTLQHINSTIARVISGPRLEVGESCAVLGYHAASSSNFAPTFRDIGPETSVRNYYYPLRDNPEECSSHNSILSYFVGERLNDKLLAHSKHAA